MEICLIYYIGDSGGVFEDFLKKQDKPIRSIMNGKTDPDLHQSDVNKY